MKSVSRQLWVLEERNINRQLWNKVDIDVMFAMSDVHFHQLCSNFRSQVPDRIWKTLFDRFLCHEFR